MALFLAAFVALCITLFACRGACYCLISYWTVLNKWEESRWRAHRRCWRARSGDRAAQARVSRRSEKLHAREARRLAPRQPRLRRWLVNFHLPNFSRPKADKVNSAIPVQTQNRLTGNQWEGIGQLRATKIGGGFLVRGRTKACPCLKRQIDGRGRAYQACGGWCGRPESNRHRPFGPTDFRTPTAFAAQSGVVHAGEFGVWTIPSP